MADSELSEQSEKPCNECALPIPVSAKKCSTCGAYQDWRRALPFSTTVLALVVALISVLTAAAPVLKQTFTAPHGRLIVALVSIERNLIKATVSNSGEVPLTVTDAEVHFENLSFDVAIRVGSGDGMVGPNQTRPATIAMLDQLGGVIPLGAANGACTLVVRAVDARGHELFARSNRSEDCSLF